MFLLNNFFQGLLILSDNKKVSKFILFILILACSLLRIFPASSQKISRIKRIGKRSWHCNEPSIAFNPLNQLQILIATNTNHLFCSKNGGRNFRHQKVQSSFGVYGDPVLKYGLNGECFFVHLSRNPEKNWPEWFDCIVVQKSTDHGISWNDGAAIGLNGKMHDKPWIHIDEEINSPYKGSIYISWTQFDKYNSSVPGDSSQILFSRSTDAGLHFSTPVRVNDLGGDCRDGDSTLEGATLGNMPDGTLFMVWAGYGRLYFDKSTDGGKTWGTDQVIASIADGWKLEVPGFMRCNGLPFVHVSPDFGIRVVTAHDINGRKQIMLYESHDLGKNWKTTRVSDLNETADHTMPHADWDKKSRTYRVLYYEIKNNQVQVILSSLNPGAQKFEHHIISRKPFEVPGESLFFGDYIQVSTHDDVTYMVWTEVEKNQSVVKAFKLK